MPNSPAELRDGVARWCDGAHEGLLKPIDFTKTKKAPRERGLLRFGGSKGIRTPDPLHAMQVRYRAAPWTHAVKDNLYRLLHARLLRLRELVLQRDRRAVLPEPLERVVHAV